MSIDEAAVGYQFDWRELGGAAYPWRRNPTSRVARASPCFGEHCILLTLDVDALEKQRWPVYDRCETGICIYKKNI